MPGGLALMCLQQLQPDCDSGCPAWALFVALRCRPPKNPSLHGKHMPPDFLLRVIQHMPDSPQLPRAAILHLRHESFVQKFSDEV
jgi:hypothetical protein